MLLQTSQTKPYRDFREGHVLPIQTFHVEYISFAKITIAPNQHFLRYFASCFAHSSTNRKLSLGKFFKDLLQHEGSGLSVAILHSYSRTASLVLNPIWRTRDKGVLYLSSCIFISLFNQKTKSSPVPLPDLYFYLFSYPIDPIVSSTGGIV